MIYAGPVYLDQTLFTASYLGTNFMRLLHVINLALVKKFCLVFFQDYFSPEYYGNLIYDKFILDMPKIMDACSLFRPGNKLMVQKMVDNVFKVVLLPQ